jgi:multidrug efflux system outer membrane protein
VPGSGGSVTDTYSVNARVSAFELDFWGAVRNLSTAARAEYFARIEAQRAFRLSLIRDVASTYLGLREAVERIALAEATVNSRRDELRIAKVRLDAGITSALDFNQAEALLTQAETQLAAWLPSRCLSPCHWPSSPAHPPWRPGCRPVCWSTARIFSPRSSA